MAVRKRPSPAKTARPRGAGAPRGPARRLPTERKYVSILRVDLHRSTDLVVELELEEAIDRLMPALQEMRAAVHAQGGIIHREMGDGIFAVFGAPFANDFHAISACLAAFDLLRRIEALSDPDIKVRIGVHSGQVVAGPRTVDLSSTYEIDGPALIMAERLQSAAEPGQVLVSANCKELAEGYIRFGPAVEHQLKGFPRPVPLHVAEGVGELSKWRVNATRRRTLFVGRDTEMARLLEATVDADGRPCGGCTAIVGEAGVGKSRLAREFVETLRGRGWRVFGAECSSILGQSPFSLLKSLLIDLGDAEEGTSLHDGLQPAQAAALDVILEREGDKAAWTALSPQARGRAIVAAARTVATRQAGRGPTVLLLEDLQWADEASTPALLAILALVGQLPLLVLGTIRSGGVPEWFERASSIQVSLRTLDAADGLAMLDELLGSSPRLAALKRQILAHTGGMPLFVEEVCRRLVEVGTLKGEWGKLEPAAPATELGVPLTVQGVIASRIDSLAPVEKRMLQVAAAIGPHVSSWLMKKVAAVTDAAFQNVLAALTGAAMLLPAAGLAEPPDGGLDFAHELVRQVAYDAVLAPDRVDLHKRIMEALESAVDDVSDPEHAAAMVHHALRAEQWDKAAIYALAIARRSFSQSALPDAMRHYEMAMNAVDRLPASPAREGRAIDLRIEARLSYANLGKVAQWLDLAKEAETRSTALGDDQRRVAALAMQAAALNFCGAPSDALSAGAAAVVQATKIGNPGWIAYAQYGLGQGHYVAGNYRDAIDNFEQAHRRFAEGATPPMGGSAAQAGLLCCMMACLCHVARGDDGAATEAQRVADETAAREANPIAAIAAGYSRGALLLHRQEPAEAEAALAQAMALVTRHEVNLFIPVIAGLHGLSLLLLDRVDDAKQALALARTAAESLGHRSAGLRAEIYGVLCDAMSGMPCGEGLSAIQARVQVARQHGYEPLELEGLLLEGALHEAAGDMESAPLCAKRAAEVADRIGAAGTFRDFRLYAGRLVGATD